MKSAPARLAELVEVPDQLAVPVIEGDARLERAVVDRRARELLDALLEEAELPVEEALARGRDGVGDVDHVGEGRRLVVRPDPVHPLDAVAGVGHDDPIEEVVAPLHRLVEGVPDEGAAVGLHVLVGVRDRLPDVPADPVRHEPGRLQDLGRREVAEVADDALALGAELARPRVPRLVERPRPGEPLERHGSPALLRHE